MCQPAGALVPPHDEVAGPRWRECSEHACCQVVLRTALDRHRGKAKARGRKDYAEFPLSMPASLREACLR